MGETDEIVSRAGALLDLGRDEESLALVGRALMSDPANGEAHLLAARAHLRAGRPEQAWHHAVAVVRDDPEDVLGHFVLSCIEVDCGRKDLALAHAQRVCDLAPESSLGHIAAAAASLNEAGRADTARRAAWQAARLAPLDPDPHVWVARAHMYNGRGSVPPADRRVARAALEEALRLEPRHSDALAELAMLDSMGFSWRSALRGHAGVLAENPHAVEARGGVAFVFGRMIWWTHIVVWALWALAFIFTAADGGGGRWPARIAAVLAVGALTSLAWIIGRSLGATVWHHLRAFPRQDPLGAAWSGLLLVMTGLIVVGAVAPLATAVTALALGRLVLLGAVIISWIRRARS